MRSNKNRRDGEPSGGCTKSTIFGREVASIPDVIHFVRAVCEDEFKLGLNSVMSAVMELAVMEGVTNAIKYGLPEAASSDDTIAVYLTILPDRIEVRIKDHGPGFQIDSVKIPDLNAHPENGYGVFIMKNLMDAVDYIISDDENILILTKYL